jgi:pyridoxamine 5'-phosphate oxidase
MPAFPFPDDPLEGLASWYAEAREAGEPEPEAMTLATSTPDGAPSARLVLMKGISSEGVRFFTNLRSRKGTELAANPRVAAVLFWPRLARQVRLEGRVVPLPAEASDAYFASRPRESQLNSAASPQSQPIESLASLEAEVASLAARLEGQPVPRPSHWGGFTLVAGRVELWVGDRFRLHQRALYVRRDRGWDRSLLAP